MNAGHVILIDGRERPSYPLADRPPGPGEWRAVAGGPARPIMPGEWYLSGAIVKAYRYPPTATVPFGDGSAGFYVPAQLVRVELVRFWREVET